VKALSIKRVNSSNAILLSVALLNGCNQNDNDVQIDTTKPVIIITDASLVMGVVTDSTSPVSFTIADKGRIKAVDDSGSVSLSVADVEGLSKAQVTLATDGTLTANNILATVPIGRGYVVIRATDSSGNYTDNNVYFDISPATTSTQANIAVGQSLTLRFPVMANSQQASVTLPTNPAGVSAVTNLAGNELSVTLATNSSAVAGELKPKVRVITAAGEIYSFILTVNMQKAVPVDSTPPNKVSENLPFIDFAGETNQGTFTLNEPIASVSNIKFVNAKTGGTMTGGAASAKISEVNSMVVNMDYTIEHQWGGSSDGIRLCLDVKDLAGNSSNICSNKYGVN
jgi:hypothetical protein